MTFIEPLDLEEWFVHVFSGSPEIFVVVSLLMLTMMAAYFRMTYLITVFMGLMFLALFSPTVSSPFLILITFLGLLAFAVYFVKMFVSNRT